MLFQYNLAQLRLKVHRFKEIIISMKQTAYSDSVTGHGDIEGQKQFCLNRLSSIRDYEHLEVGVLKLSSLPTSHPHFCQTICLYTHKQ